MPHWFACVCVCVCVCVCACACVVSCLSCRLVSVSAYKAYYGLSVSLPHSSSAPQTADRHHFCFLFLFTTICSSETQLCRICPTALVQTRLARSPLSHTRTYTHTHTHTHTHTSGSVMLLLVAPPSTIQHYYAALIRPHLLQHQRHIHEHLCVCV